MNRNENDAVSMVINLGTGETTETLYYGDRILRAETSEYLQNTIEIGKDVRFIKLFESAFTALGNESLTGKQWQILTIIIKYFKYDSGLVAFDNGVPITADNIIELSGLSRKTVYEAIDKLVSKKIIAKTKVGFNIKYYANPFIFCKGKRVNKTLFTMFKDTKWKDYHCSESQLG